MLSFFDRTIGRIPAVAELKFARALNREKTVLARDLASSAPPAPANLVSLDAAQATWEVHVPGKPVQFMSLASGHDDASRFVVQVSGDKFYRAWLNKAAPASREGRGDACLLRDEMASDYKFKHAEAGFARGRESPVPLAECFCARAGNGEPRISFDNGVTRTFWLLAHRAESFPVVVANESAAHALHRAAGIGPVPAAMSDLFDQARRQAMPAAAKPEA